VISLEYVSLISIQASFSNRRLVPDSIPARQAETAIESISRKLVKTGELVIDPIPNCSLEQFVGQLEAAGFELVDAFSQERVNHKDLKRPYQMIRFIFARRERAHPTEIFQAQSDVVRWDLQKLLRTAFWRVRIFRNPFIRDGKQLPGEFSLSVNLESRVNRFKIVDGKEMPETARRKENGKKIGDPVPLNPDFQLSVWQGNNIEAIRLESINEAKLTSVN